MHVMGTKWVGDQPGQGESPAIRGMAGRKLIIKIKCFTR